MNPPDYSEAELMALYLAESRDAVRAAGKRLAALRKAEKARQTQLLDSVRATGHRLKGSGGTYGRDEVSRLGSALETLMKAALSGQRRPDAVFLAEAEGLLASLQDAFRS